MCFNFCICFFSRHSYRNYKFYNRIKICAIIAGINTYKLIIKKKKKKHDKTVLLEKTDLNSIEVLISKALTDPNISHDEFVLVRNVFKEYDDMRKEIKKIKT